MAQPRNNEGLDRLGVYGTAFDKADVVGQKTARMAVKKVPNFGWRQREYRCQGLAGHRPNQLNLVAVAFGGGPKPDNGSLVGRRVLIVIASSRPWRHPQEQVVHPKASCCRALAIPVPVCRRYLEGCRHIEMAAGSIRRSSTTGSMKSRAKQVNTRIPGSESSSRRSLASARSQASGPRGSPSVLGYR